MITSYAQFYEVTVKMRKAQKEYFKSREPSRQIIAKDLEAQIDEAITQHEAKIRPVQPELVPNETYTKSPGVPVFSALKGA